MRTLSAPLLAHAVRVSVGNCEPSGFRIAVNTSGDLHSSALLKRRGGLFPLPAPGELASVSEPAVPFCSRTAGERVTDRCKVSSFDQHKYSTHEAFVKLLPCLSLERVRFPACVRVLAPALHLSHSFPDSSAPWSVRIRVEGMTVHLGNFSPFLPEECSAPE